MKKNPQKQEKENPHKNHRQRMRRRYRSGGLKAFQDHEVLEFLLFYCYKQCDTNEKAHYMLKKFKTLHNLFDADVETLMEVLNCSENVAVLLNLIPALANRYYSDKWGKGKILDNEESAGKHAMNLFVGEKIEKLYVICLDKKFKLINDVCVSEGTIDEAPIFIREITKAALQNHATAIILAHNHPSGSTKPSKSDLEATRRIVEGLEIMEIKVIDHIIAAGDTYYSFAARRQHVYGYF